MKKDPLISTQLGRYPPETLLDQEALAQALDVSPRTLRRMVARFELPPGMTLGGRKVWIVRKVLEYLTERAEELARKAGQAAAKLGRLL